jgi:hypothetical protein
LRKALILIGIMFICGCTARRFVVRSPDSLNPEPFEKLVENVRKNNISNKDFYIEKALFTINVNNETKRFLFSLKFKMPDTYLISIKNITGFEALRILITKDTLLVNERIGKRILYAKPGVLEKKTGLPFYALNILFGDLSADDFIIKQSEGTSNELYISQRQGRRVWTSVLDPEKEKVLSTEISDGTLGEAIKINFSKFRKKYSNAPSIIEFQSPGRGIRAKIKLERIEMSWNGLIEFVPGKGYTREEIK